MSRIVVIGVGSIGSRHVDTLLALGFDDLLGYDIRPNLQEDRLPVVDQFEDLLDWQPEYALVCSPPQEHYNQAERLLREARAHVFIEKPMCATWKGARLLCEQADEVNRCLAIGYMERAHPAVRTAKAWVERGRIQQATLKCYWRRVGKSYELPIFNESSHVLDLALYLFGAVKDIYERTVSETTASIFLQHESGTMTHVVIDQNADPVREIHLLRSPDQCHTEIYGMTRHEWDACYRDELIAFLQGEPLCTGRDGLNVMQLLEQLR